MYAGFLTIQNRLQLVCDPSVWQNTNYMRLFNFVNIETVIGLCNQANSGNYNLFLIVCNPYGQKLTLRQPPQQNILYFYNKIHI